MFAFIGAGIVLSGYPPGWLALNGLTIAVVLGYMHLFKFRAHDGRRI